MIYLFLHVVLISGFGILLKDAENRRHRLDPIGLVNYATAFVFSCALAQQANSFAFTPLTLIFGLVTGISYAFGFVLVVAGMRLSGIVVTTAVIGLSMILPILFSVFFLELDPKFLAVIRGYNCFGYCLELLNRLKARIGQLGMRHRKLP